MLMINARNKTVLFSIYLPAYRCRLLSKSKRNSAGYRNYHTKNPQELGLRKIAKSFTKPRTTGQKVSANSFGLRLEIALKQTVLQDSRQVCPESIQALSSSSGFFSYGGGFVVGAVGVMGACGNGVIIKGAGAVMLLLKSILGQRSKFAVSVKYAVLARTIPVWRMPELD